MLKEGDTYSETVSFTQANVETFARITGDFNPLHIDNEYAAKTHYKRPIVHGMYAASTFSRVLGNVFPGVGSIALHREQTYIRPVYVNEEYTMHFKVIEVDSKKMTGKIRCIMKNPEGKTCITGVATLKNPLRFG